MKTSNNGLVDYSRFVAALAIVWMNIDVPGNWLAKVAMPLFLVLLFADAEARLVSNAQRYLKPYVIWSALYALFGIALLVKSRHSELELWDWQTLLSGTWYHLWILPYLFVAAMLSPWFRHPLASLGAAILIACLFAVNGSPASQPALYWSLGAIPLLVAIGFAAWGWRLAATTLGLSFAILYLGQPSPEVLTFLAGTAMALIIMSYRLPTSALSAKCARMSLVIYLVHPMVTIAGQSLRITWIELGLFSIVGCLIFAMVIDHLTMGARERSQ